MCIEVQVVYFWLVGVYCGVLDLVVQIDMVGVVVIWVWQFVILCIQVVVGYLVGVVGVVVGVCVIGQCQVVDVVMYVDLYGIGVGLYEVGVVDCVVGGDLVGVDV